MNKVIGIISQMYAYMILSNVDEIIGYSDTHYQIEYGPDGKQLPKPIILEEDEYILDESAWD